MNKKKIFIVVFLVLGIITLLLGSAYALFIFNGKGSINNAKSGQVYLTLNSTNNGLDLNNQKPISDEEGINQEDYYEFSVSGYVTGKNPIIYKISVVNGDDIEGLTRFRDSDIKLYLTDENDERLVLTTGNDLENGMLVYKDNIIGGTREELITKTYRLRTWLSDNVLVSNKDIPNKSIYSMEEFNNSYYSVKIKVDSDRVGGPTLALDSTNGRFTVNSLVGADLHNYKIFGNSVQNGTPTPNAPVAVESLGERTKNLFNKNDVVAGYINQYGNVGDNVNWRVSNYISIEPNTNYTFSAINYIGNVAYHAWYDNNKVFISSVKLELGTTTLLSPANAKYLRTCFRLDSGTGDTLQVEQDSTATDYEPYGYRVSVKVSGKNLFDEVWELGSINIVNGLNSTSTTDIRTKNYIQVQPNTTYYFYLTPSSNGIWYYPVSYNSNKGFNSYMGAKIGQFSFTTDSNTHYIRLYQYNNTNIPEDVQLELGTTKNSYEPYKEPIITNIYLDEPLRKVGDASDYIDYGNQKIVRNIAKYEITGNESISENFNSNMFSIYRTGNTTAEALNKCTHYIGGLRGGTPFVNRPNSCFVQQRSTDMYVSLGKNSMSTISDFRTWLQGQYDVGTPVTIYYQLASTPPTPVTLPSIPTFHGVTYLEVVSSNGISPSNIEIEYYD